MTNALKALSQPAVVKYRVEFGEIRKITVLRETAHFVWWAPGDNLRSRIRQTSKNGHDWNTGLFDTQLEAAKAYSQLLQAKIEELEAQLVRARERAAAFSQREGL